MLLVKKRKGEKKEPKMKEFNLRQRFYIKYAWNKNLIKI